MIHQDLPLIDLHRHLDGSIRLEIGKVKADQIKATGAKTVITNCYNCRTQISELNRKYKLGVEVKSIVEAVADSLDLG